MCYSILAIDSDIESNLKTMLTLTDGNDQRNEFQLTTNETMIHE
jgi:hypothetical protein